MSQLDQNLAKLPEMCFGTMPSDGSLILLKRGETGYWPAEGYYTTDLHPTFDHIADLINERRGVTPKQRMAMEFGSMCGFDKPGADPDQYGIDVLIGQTRREPGGDVLADEMIKMRQAGADEGEIRARFLRILDEARPDLAAKAN